MDYVNNGSNSYGPGDAVSSSVASMSLGEQQHQENGVQAGHRGPGDAKMKGQTLGTGGQTLAGGVVGVYPPVASSHRSSSHSDLLGFSPQLIRG